MLKSVMQYRTAFALSVVYFLALMDRQVVAVLFDPIKEDLALSDTQLAMVSGLAFALFYSVAGLPLGRLADRTNRVTMLSVCLAIWSLATAATGLAANFIQLLLARVGVGVGEGGCSPAAHSIMSDSFEAKDRSTAIGIYFAGGTLGSATAYLLGGWMVEFYGWRAAMYCVGLPGLAIALAFYFLMKEPPRPKATSTADNTDSMMTTMLSLLKNPCYMIANIGHVAASGYMFVLATWLPSYINRNFELSYGEIGTFLFGSTLLGAVAGSLLSGIVTDRLFRRNVKWLAGMPALFLLVAGPIAVVGCLTTDLRVLFVAVVLIKGFLVGSYVPSYSIVHYVTSASKKGVAIALKIMAVSIIGVGIMPLIVGMISDVLQDSYGNASLRYGLLGFALLCPIGAGLFASLLKILPAKSVDEIEKEQAGLDTEDVVTA